MVSNTVIRWCRKTLDDRFTWLQHRNRTNRSERIRFNSLSRGHSPSIITLRISLFFPRTFFVAWLVHRWHWSTLPAFSILVWPASEHDSAGFTHVDDLPCAPPGVTKCKRARHSSLSLVIWNISGIVFDGICWPRNWPTSMNRPLRHTSIRMAWRRPFKSWPSVTRDRMIPIVSISCAERSVHTRMTVQCWTIFRSPSHAVEPFLIHRRCWTRIDWFSLNNGYPNDNWSRIRSNIIINLCKTSHSNTYIDRRQARRERRRRRKHRC